MNKEKIEKLIIKVGKVIDLARKISGKIFSLAILYFFALVVIIFLMLLRQILRLQKILIFQHQVRWM